MSDDRVGRQATPRLTRRDFLLAGAGVGAGLYWGVGSRSLTGAARAQAVPVGLDIFAAGYPRAFFFRQVELEANQLSFEAWEKRFLPLDGIMGKVFKETSPFYRANNLSYFWHYKQRNPTKAVFLHYDASGRRPSDEALTKFFPGHWLHYGGTRLTRPVRASRTSTVLYVGNTAVFKIGRAVGVRGERVNDDISIVPIAGGKPDWRRSEQVRLRGINTRAKTITVERGAYGTRPAAWATGAHLAAHVINGPTDDEGGPTGEPMWHYNYSTVGPKDARGRNGGDALLDYLVGKLGPGGDLSTFDGISLDVLAFSTRAISAGDVDGNGDGQRDGGVLGGIDTVSQGRLRFTQSLRSRLPDKILMADGVMPEGPQRSFGDLNGVETEGYPETHDLGLESISSGENRFNFWKAQSSAPSLNYIQYKYRDKTGARRNYFSEPSVTEDQSYKKLRLALASAQFTDAALATRGGPDGISFWGPPETLWREQNTGVYVFDELWRGQDQVPNWMGLPTGDTVYLASGSPDLLDGRGNGEPGSWTQAFRDRFQGADAAFDPMPDGTPGMRVRSTRAWDATPPLNRTVAFELPRVEAAGRDLFIALRLKVDRLQGYPSTVARRANVAVAPTGAAAMGNLFTWAGGDWFTATFCFEGVGARSVDVGFSVEGDMPVYLERLTAHSAAGAVYREFENGAVFANLSAGPHTFDLGTLFPGRSFRRIQGQPNQAGNPNNADPTRRVNDGTSVDSMLTIPPRDALFVVKTTASP